MGIIAQIIVGIIIEAVICLVQWRAVRPPESFNDGDTMVDGQAYEPMDDAHANADYQGSVNRYLQPSGSDDSAAIIVYVLCGIVGGVFFVYLSLAYSAICTVLITIVVLQYIVSMALMARNHSFEYNRNRFLSRLLEFVFLLVITVYTCAALNDSRLEGSFSKLLQGTDGVWHRKFIDDFITIGRNVPSWQFTDWLDAIQLTAGAIMCLCFLVWMMLDSMGMFVIAGNFVPARSGGFMAGKAWTFNSITRRDTVHKMLWSLLALILSSRSVVAIIVWVYELIANFISNSYTH